MRDRVNARRVGRERTGGVQLERIQLFFFRLLFCGRLLLLGLLVCLARRACGLGGSGASWLLATTDRFGPLAAAAVGGCRCISWPLPALFIPRFTEV